MAECHVTVQSGAVRWERKSRFKTRCHVELDFLFGAKVNKRGEWGLARATTATKSTVFPPPASGRDPASSSDWCPYLP